MKYCQNCGEQVQPNQRFCSNCGFNLGANKVVNNISKKDNLNSNDIAIAGFIISIISFIFCFGIMSPISLILSIIGLSNAKKFDDKNKKFAIAGIVISVVAMLLVTLFITYLTANDFFIDELGSQIDFSNIDTGRYY